MQLEARWRLEEKLWIPNGPEYLAHTMIYHALGASDPEYTTKLHEKGKVPGNIHVYTHLLTEDPRSDDSMIQMQKDGSTILKGNLLLTVRSADASLILKLKEGFRKGSKLDSVYVSDVETELSDPTVEESTIVIDMMSAICVHRTDVVEKDGKEKKITVYLSPKEEEFYSRINNSFRRKYEAYYGVAPEEDILLSPISVPDKNYHTVYENHFHINGWKGRYLLKGKRKYLDFLYQTGIGSKNSQGFGMFEIV